MQIDILTTFPEMFAGPFDFSIMKRAQEKGLVKIRIHNLREWTSDNHRSTDDSPFGGGPGMVMMVEPIDKALEAINAKKHTPKQKIILTSAKGELFTQQVAKNYSEQLERMTIICGHYEGVDERVARYLVDEEVRIGNFVITGGELAAMIMVDSTVRLLPGVLGDDESIVSESHTIPGILEYPQYTRPQEYKWWKVPEVLLHGNHADIVKWREQMSKEVED